MVSFYNHPAHLAMYQKNGGANLSYSPTASWYQSNYHHPSNAQFMGDSEAPPQPMYGYSHMFPPQGSPEWPSHEFPGGQNPLLQPPGQMHHNQQPHSAEHLTDGLNSIPSPPITVSGSEMSSPGAPIGPISPHPRPPNVKSPYEWIKKTSYQNQPNPDPNNPQSKTRTKDKYRVVYTDYQRLELEKEYHTSRYITIRRKTELARDLSLSERQVKIWFQNRRAKERKQSKKRDDGQISSSAIGLPQHNAVSISTMLDTKPKLEHAMHLQHPALHQMSAMSMGMSSMGLHHHHHALHHGHMGVPAPSVAPLNSQHSLHQSQHLATSPGAIGNI